MRLHKWVYPVVILIVLTVFSCGCNTSNSYKRSIYTDNSKIAEDGNRCLFYKVSFNPEDKKTTIKFEEFIGRETIWLVKATEAGKINVTYKSKIEKGKFKVVFVSSDKTVTDIFEGEGSGDFTVEVPKGDGQIKIVGVDTNGSVDLSLEVEGSITITKPE